MVKNIKIKKDILIIGIIILLLVGGFIGNQLFKSPEPIYTGEYVSFVVSNVNIFAWVALEGVCYSKLKEYAPNFPRFNNICFVSRSGTLGVNSIVSYNVACDCYGTNYNIRK